MNRLKSRLTALSFALAGGLGSPQVWADSLDLNLEELMNVVVTLVSKKTQTLADTAAVG